MPTVKEKPKSIVGRKCFWNNREFNILGVTGTGEEVRLRDKDGQIILVSTERIELVPDEHETQISVLKARIDQERKAIKCHTKNKGDALFDLEQFEEDRARLGEIAKNCDSAIEDCNLRITKLEAELDKLTKESK